MAKEELKIKPEKRTQLYQNFLKKNNPSFLYELPKLIRFGVSLAVSFSAATGYIVAKGYVDFLLIYTFTGVFLMAAGASALNQYQERKTDLLMRRTQNRPIPSNKITSLTGLSTALFFSLSGVLLLYFFAGIIPALLGLFNLLWYNGLYTNLKKITAFAVVPGSLTGVTPLLIGWSAAGGYLLNPVIVFISFFMYMWQIPHFWLLLIKYNDEYQKAGLGSLSSSFSEKQAKRIVFAWILGTSLTSLLFPYFGIIKQLWLSVILIVINIGIVTLFYSIVIRKQEGFDFKKAFVSINAFLFLVMLILILEILVF